MDRAQLDLRDGAQKVDTLTEKESEWRLAIEKGSLIDAVKRDLKCKAQMWAKAKVVNVLGDNISDLAQKKLVITF